MDRHEYLFNKSPQDLTLNKLNGLIAKTVRTQVKGIMASMLVKDLSNIKERARQRPQTVRKCKTKRKTKRRREEVK